MPAIQNKQPGEPLHTSPAAAGSDVAFPENQERSFEMNKSIPLLAAAITVIAGVSIATSSNAQTSLSDAAYCQSLVRAYSKGGNARGSVPVGNDTAVAIAQCREGDAQSAIPVLEHKLRASDIPLPARS
jgi:hypothetical protein